VDQPVSYDLKINKAYGELGAHYRVLIDPARAGEPKDKPRIERPMPDIRDSFWRGRGNTFTGSAHMRVEAVRWCAEGPGSGSAVRWTGRPCVRPLAAVKGAGRPG
jgi:hypothetical protein